MRIPRIYTQQELLSGATVRLESGPSQHISRVLRMQAGAALILFDGRGGQYPATISAIERRQVLVTTGDRQQCELESPLQIHLGIAISRGDRMDQVVQKATELGVGAISVLLSERTEVKLQGDRALKKLQHWQQVAISACEQCGRNRLPVINPLQTLDNWLLATDAQLKFVLHHRATPVDDAASAPRSLALLIGPEGGLSNAEITAAERAGYAALRLGPRILRTETAPLAAIAILQARWGDMAPRG